MGKEVYSKVNGQVGWYEVDEVQDVGCCDCSEPATEIVDAGRNRDGARILWAMCDGCRFESYAANADARAQSRYECDYA